MSLNLQKKEKFLQLVLDNIPSFVFWKDRESIYLGCNLNFAKSAGLTSTDEIIGKSDYDLPWSKKDSDFYRKIDKEVMDSGVSQINFEESQTVDDGPINWLRTSKIPLFNSKNKVIGILGAYENITPRKIMELELIRGNKELRELNAKLEMANIDLEQFAYATSHDLQEPLSTIEGFSRLLQNKYAGVFDKNGVESLNYIIKETQRMASLIRQVLDYSKIEKIKDKFERVDLGQVVKSAIDDLGILINKSNALLKINLPKQKINCNPKKMKVLFKNLISNGVKFNQSKIPTIEITFKENEAVWHFTIKDNGIGIKEVFQDTIFKPFKRLNLRHKFPGNGLGLSVCRKIVSLHGGKIYYTPNQYEGSSFHFTILKT